MSDFIEVCPKCRGPMSWKQAYRYPTWTQISFALSFCVFLLVFPRIQSQRFVVWSWSIAQALLGVVLIRFRLRARRRVLRCNRCEAALP